MQMFELFNSSVRLQNVIIIATQIIHSRSKNYHNYYLICWSARASIMKCPLLVFTVGYKKSKILHISKIIFLFNLMFVF